MAEPSIHRGFREHDRAAITRLLREYEAGLGVSLCFQGFEAELAGLPGEYAPPDGAFLTATAGDGPVGVVALRLLDRTCSIAEMKRLYVSPPARGTGLGRRLAEAIIAEARALGYARLRLDTLPIMTEAQALYAALGFVEIAPYAANPVRGVRFLERDLAAGP